MFGRTQQLFSRGQRALSRREFTRAEAFFRAAIARAPYNAHFHLYLAHALAEQERLPEAERSLALATDMAPTGFVFHLHHGILLLDAGDPARARSAVAAAATLAPANRLVAGYVELVAWIDGGGEPSPRLRELAGELPESFGARVLLHLAATVLETRGPRAAVGVLEEPREPLGLPLGLWLGGLRHRDRLGYAEHLLGRERFDDAAYFIASQPALMSDPRAPAMLNRARRGALQAIEVALAGCAPGRRGTLLLERYEVENDLDDQDALMRTLTEWRELYAAAGAPRAERHLAAAVTRRMAAVEVARARYKDALMLCAASRAARAERETAGVEALARLGLGERRAARHAFEAFLEKALFRVDIRLAAAAANSPA